MKSWSLILLLLISLQSFSQNPSRQIRKDTKAIIKTQTTYIKPDTSLHFTGNIKVPFNTIHVWDARLDTTMLCTVLYYNILTGISVEKSNFKGGAGKGMSFFLNNYFKNNFDSSKGDMLCVIKKLSLDNKDTLLHDNMSAKKISFVTCDIECFYRQGDNYYPATKLDTTISEEVIPKISVIHSFATKLMTALGNKLSRINPEKVLQRKSYTKQALEENYTSRFDMPILKDTVVAKGIYRNISEFRNNKPSITNFNYSFEKNSKITLLDENKEPFNTLHLFGFSDGSSAWLISGNMAFPLIRINNSFELIVHLPLSFFPYVINLLATVDLEDDLWAQKITWQLTRYPR